MDKRIIDLYKVSFQNIIIRTKGGISRIHKTITTNNLELSEFLQGWSSVDYITTELLPLIDGVLNNISEMKDAESEDVGVIIKSDNATLYGLSNGASPISPDFVLSTKDFKEILEGWLDFLGTLPLNGTKM